jgi:hypothetical protein
LITELRRHLSGKSSAESENEEQNWKIQKNKQ